MSEYKVAHILSQQVKSCSECQYLVGKDLIMHSKRKRELACLLLIDKGTGTISNEIIKEKKMLENCPMRGKALELFWEDDPCKLNLIKESYLLSTGHLMS